METPLAVLSHVTRVLEEQGVAYTVVGSFASSLHGLYRATGDVDIVADIRPEQVGPIVAALQSDFYIDGQAVRRAVARRRSFNVIHLESVFKVDVFIPPRDDFNQQQLVRRRPEKLKTDEELTLYVATAEDTILSKLRWYRAGGAVSNTQWADVRGIIGAQGGGLDLSYMRGWADRLGVRDLLEKALDESR
jgi:hypothetical protein